MKRLTRIVLAAAGLVGLAACTNVSRSAPAPADRRVVADAADVTASNEEMVAADDMLRDASVRLTAPLDDPWRDKLGLALEELSAYFVDGNEDRARQALAEARDLVAAYDGPPCATADLAAIERVLDRVARLLGEK